MSDHTEEWDDGPAGEFDNDPVMPVAAPPLSTRVAEFFQKPELWIPPYWSRERIEAAVLLPWTLVKAFFVADFPEDGSNFGQEFNQLACDLQGLAYIAFAPECVRPPHLGTLDLLLPHRHSANDELVARIASVGTERAVNILLAHGVDITVPSEGFAEGLLGTAVDYDNWVVVEHLLSPDIIARTGASLETCSPHKLHPLARARSFDMVGALLKGGRCPRGTNALHAFAADGDDAILRLLLESGADPNETFNMYRPLRGEDLLWWSSEITPLEAAEKCSRHRTIQILSNYGAKP